MDFSILVAVITATLNTVGLAYAAFTYKNTFEPRLILKYVNPAETDSIGVLQLKNIGKSTAYDLQVITPKGLGFEVGSEEYLKRIRYLNRGYLWDEVEGVFPVEIFMNGVFKNQIYDLVPGDDIRFPYWVLYKNGDGESRNEESADGFKKDSVFIVTYKIKSFNLFKKKRTLELKANPNILNGLFY